MWRSRLALVCCLALGIAAAAKAQDPSLLTLDRIISADEFRTEGFGPARWLEDGSGYTTLEAAEGGRDLVKVDPATGRREVLVAGKSLVPPGGKSPIAVADYAWSKDGKALLLFT